MRTKEINFQLKLLFLLYSFCGDKMAELKVEIPDELKVLAKGMDKKELRPSKQEKPRAMQLQEATMGSPYLFFIIKLMSMIKKNSRLILRSKLSSLIVILGVDAPAVTPIFSLSLNHFFFTFSAD